MRKREREGRSTAKVRIQLLRDSKAKERTRDGGNRSTRVSGLNKGGREGGKAGNAGFKNKGVRKEGRIGETRRTEMQDSPTRDKSKKEGRVGETRYRARTNHQQGREERREGRRHGERRT